MKHTAVLAMATLILACNAASETQINKDIYISKGEHQKGSLRSVNGSITIDHEAIVEGNCSTVNGTINVGENCDVGEISCVNGTITVDRNSKIEEVSTVNGSIELGSEVDVNGDASTVNGQITSKMGVKIAGGMNTVNGDMTTIETRIVGDMSTVNGDISLQEKSVVEGNIIIKRDNLNNKRKKHKPLVVTIDSKSKVKGDIEVRGDDPKVTVILTGGGEVLGKITNAEVVRK